MALVKINKTDWALVDGDGLTLRIIGRADAETLAEIIGDYGTRLDHAGWIDVAQAIFEALDEERVAEERAPK